MMKNDAAPSPSEQEKKKEQSIGRRLLNALIHNWGWKVASLALAVCLWGVLITQDTSLPRTKTIEGVRVTVLEVLNPDVKLVVEEYGTLSGVPVEVRRLGDVPEGIYATSITRSTELVDISGPKSIVEKAARCVVEYDQSTLSLSNSPNTVTLPFYFEDAEGNVLDGTNITATPRGQVTAIQRITLTQNVYAMTRVKVDENSLLRGEPAEGYAVSNIRVIPTSITLAGSEVAIAPYLEEGAALFPYDPVDISGQSRTVSHLLYLNTPGNMDYISNSFFVQVVVTILPEEFVKLSTDSNP